MSPKVFLGWLIAATASLVAALAVTLAQPDLAKVSLVNEPAFPKLRANPDAAAAIVIRHADFVATLTRGEPATLPTSATGTA